MSDSTNSDLSSMSDDDSEYNFIPGPYAGPYYNVEKEQESNNSDSDSENEEQFDGDRAYTDEPLASKEWLKEYKKEQEDKNKRLESLKDRLSGKESLSNC